MADIGVSNCKEHSIGADDGMLRIEGVEGDGTVDCGSETRISGRRLWALARVWMEDMECDV